jgi:hypothetical protein
MDTNAPAHSDSGIMTPQIVFQCLHCRIKLQVPIFYAGQVGPCPQCGQTIQTPVAFVAPPAPLSQTLPSSEVKNTTMPPAIDPNKRWADPTANFASDARGLTGKSIAQVSPQSRSLNRGVIADNAIHRGDQDKKEGRQVLKMLFWFVLVCLLLVAASYLMKSFAIGA